MRLERGQAAKMLETLQSRQVRAADGTHWHVREVRACEIPGAAADTCLIFDAGTITRRFWRYPELWEQMSNAELVEFAERRRDDR